MRAARRTRMRRNVAHAHHWYWESLAILRRHWGRWGLAPWQLAWRAQEARCTLGLL